MDNAVSLVRAYLHINGYLTVTEYPILEADRPGRIRVVTDLDVLAFRFPGTGIAAAGDGNENLLGTHRFSPDEALQCRPGQADMLIAEVKEGRARVNRNSARTDVLRMALARFGCCSWESSPSIVRDLLNQGEATMTSGHRLRFLIFASDPGQTDWSPFHVIELGHVVSFLRDYMKTNWSVLRHAQFKDPAFGFLMTLRKAELGAANKNRGRNE